MDTVNTPNASTPGWLWHCPYTDCWEWSFISARNVAEDRRSYTVTCPACGLRDTYLSQRNLDLFLPGLATRVPR
jgi:hypothetical protein